MRAEKKPAPNVKIHSVLHNEYHEHIRPGDVCWVSWYSGAELKSEADKDFSPVFVKSIVGHRLEDGLARLKCTWLLRMDDITTSGLDTDSLIPQNLLAVRGGYALSNMATPVFWSDQLVSHAGGVAAMLNGQGQLIDVDTHDPVKTLDATISADDSKDDDEAIIFVGYAHLESKKNIKKITSFVPFDGTNHHQLQHILPDSMLPDSVGAISPAVPWAPPALPDVSPDVFRVSRGIMEGAIFHVGFFGRWLTGYGIQYVPNGDDSVPRRFGIIRQVARRHGQAENLTVHVLHCPQQLALIGGSPVKELLAQDRADRPFVRLNHEVIAAAAGLQTVVISIEWLRAEIILSPPGGIFYAFGFAAPSSCYQIECVIDGQGTSLPPPTPPPRRARRRPRRPRPRRCCTPCMQASCCQRRRSA